MTEEELIGETVPGETPGPGEAKQPRDRELAIPGNRALCPNCDTPIDGPYCATCGQFQKNLNKQVWTLVGEVLDDVFRLDSRVSKTLYALSFKPGFLTTEYFDGRRARYTPPIRLYLVISFLFFFLTPTVNNLETVISDDEPTITIGQDEDDDQKVDEWLESVISDDESTITIGQDEDDDQKVDEWEEEVSDGISGIHFSWLTEKQNTALEERLHKQITKTVDQVRNNPAELWSGVMDLMSAVMFFMLPVFAMFLKLFYIGSRVYYAEHLLLAVHNHCFLFLATLLSDSLELLESSSVGLVAGPAAAVIAIWIPIYIYLSLRNTFGQSHTITAFKFISLALVYAILALMGLAIAFTIQVLTQ